MTLKRRIFIIFMFSSLIPFLCICLISYFTIYSILTNKIQKGIQSNLRQVELSLQNSIDNLNHVSQQLAFGSTLGKELDELLETTDPFEQGQIASQLKSELNLVAFTNPSIGLLMYYFENDGSYQFENFAVKDDFAPDRLPLLAEYYGISYYGPHVSSNRLHNQIVLSALRKLDLPDRDDVYVYIESGFNLTQNILDNNQYGSSTSHLILDNSGKVTYSEVPETFENGTMFPNFSQGEVAGTHQGYYWFRETSNQGWSVVSLIAKADYNNEMNLWLIQIIFVAVFFLGVTLLLAWLLWKMVYRPLNRFHTEIKWMTQNEMKTNPEKIRIPEFDILLNQFRDMKEQIWVLFKEVELKEKHRMDLEVETLLYQINPHFLMNTLDTVHWLAVMNGQNEIDRLVLSLNKLLFYNLGKLGQASTIGEEIDALKQYLVLQQIRYDFQFDVQIEVDENALRIPIPRFILQPLVENALYHGLNDDGYIRVNVKLSRGIEISIHDNGLGMSKDTIEKLLSNQHAGEDKVGMGIGMNYVKRMLEARYEDQAKLEIISEIGKGTSIFLSLPIVEVESWHD
jgi:two-component system sensor histidine kinase YesM